jgi:DNA polymerase I-like protein with 3'-5' exonuclease and polymerase domains
MNPEDVVCVDFETEGIQEYPDYPPMPVGVAVKFGRRPGRYYSWGHPVENNSTLEEAHAVLLDIWRGSKPLLFHQSDFDCDVAETYLGLPLPSWDRIHDTKFLLFLNDPYTKDLSLKPSAARVLGWAPAERDELFDWILAHVRKATPAHTGEHISKAPGKLVGEYAIGDVDRTYALFCKLYPEIKEKGMLEAYNRERHLMPILLKNYRRGVRVNLDRLEVDHKIYSRALLDADNWLRKRLKLGESANINSDKQMAEAFLSRGIVTGLSVTKKGNYSVSYKNLRPDMFIDVQCGQVFAYRNKLATCIGTFMEPWLRIAGANGGLLHTRWNQVKQEQGGARTGRMSNQPSLLNIPKQWKKAAGDGYLHPEFMTDLPVLPFMRVYLIPTYPKWQWGRRDYDQQELRVLAHFEDGALMRRYQENPKLDIHEEVHDNLVEAVGIDLSRDSVKIVNFADIYGRGTATQAAALGVSMNKMFEIRAAKDRLLPGVRRLKDAIKDRARQGLPVKTWGDRLYYCEEPRFDPEYGKVMDYAYRLLNYLIQGSSAEITKQSIINYDEHPKRRGYWLIAVHDENDIEFGYGATSAKHEMVVLRESMNDVPLDVPLLSSGEVGQSWGELKKYAD